MLLSLFIHSFLSQYLNQIVIFYFFFKEENKFWFRKEVVLLELIYQEKGKKKNLKETFSFNTLLTNRLVVILAHIHRSVQVYVLSENKGKTMKKECSLGEDPFTDLEL